MMLDRIACAAAVLAALLPPADGRAAEVETRTLDVGGIQRTYLLYAPARTARSRANPLVVVLHGGGGTADQVMRFTRFNALAEREGFAVVYPNGLYRRWNDSRGRADADDVGFVRAAVADAAASVGADRARIFVAGISNGGFMSLRIACEAADLFAAAAAVTATMPAPIGPNCRPTAPVSVLVMNGTADPIVPYAGGQVRGFLAMPLGAIWSTEDTVAFWARHNRCAAPDTRVLPDRDPADGSRAIEIAYPDCAGGRVKLLRIEGGGHTWPGGTQYLPASWIGPTNRDLDATEAIWAFFNSAPAR